MSKSFEAYIEEIESLNDSGKFAELEKLIYECVRTINDIPSINLLASKARWADFEDSYQGIEIAQNIMDRAIEKATSENDREALELILDELENNLELDDRADEVRSIIENLND
jgi:hypothetical protein